MRIEGSHMRLCGAFLAAACLLTAQQPIPPAAESPQQPVIRTGTQEVMLDLIVRDRKGKPIRDLKADEVEVYDENTRQKLTGFRLVTGTEPAEAKDERARLDPLRQIRLVTLLFQGMGLEERRLARSAALDFLKEPLEQNVLMSVFIIDQRLHILQPFTNDRELLRAGIDRATGGTFLEHQQRSAAVRAELEAAREGVSSAAAALQGAAQPGRGASGSDSIGAAAASAKMAEMTLSILNYADSLFRDDASRASVFSLMSLVREQAALPGRKTLVYFTPGFALTDAMERQFNETIALANRSNVSIYGVDPRGVVLDAQNAGSQDMLASAARVSATQQTTAGAVTAEQVKAFDTARDSIRANAQEALAKLSFETGGILIANTNDPRRFLGRVREDVLTYYELSYAPGITDWDGRFRRLSVRVNRKDTVVQARSGYFALPPHGAPAAAFETPLLHVLNAATLPRTFNFFAGALRFWPVPGGKFGHGLVIEVPMDGLTFVEEPENKRFRGHISFLAVVKDQQGEIVQRFSRDLGFFSEPAKLEAYKKTKFTGTFHLDLPPGRYTLETAVLDRESMKSSAARSVVAVPAARPGVAISSIALVRRTDNEPNPTDLNDPFHTAGKRIIPTLDNTFSISRDPGLSFYFVVAPGAPLAAAPQLMLELSKDGQAIAKAPLQLPAPDARGLIPYVGSLPLAKFPPGQYDLRMVVTQGESAAEERASFIVEP